MIKFLLNLLFPKYGIGEEGGGNNDDAVIDDDKTIVQDDAGKGADDKGGADDADPNAPKPGSIEGAAEAIRAGLEAKRDGTDVKTDDKKGVTDVANVDPNDPAAVEAKRVADEKKASDDAAAAEKPKKADDIQLTAEEKKILSPKAQERFHELHKVAKANEDLVVKLTADVAEAGKQSRAITEILQQSKTAPEELGQLLDFNFMVKTGKYEDALKVVNEYRVGLLKALGREEEGVDLLAEFPDLAQAVEKLEMPRERALETANLRRADAARRTQDEQRGSQQTEQERSQQAGAAAMTSIEEWQKKMMTTDIDYAARTAKVMPQIEQIVRDYPPNLWLKTIENLYRAVSVQQGTKLPKPNGELRPKNLTPGNKTPGTMLDALRQGLGYTASN